MNSLGARLAMEGFSLIEVLVALFVLSIGLLGLAALQTTGLKFSHQSYERTQAVYKRTTLLTGCAPTRAGLVARSIPHIIPWPSATCRRCPWIAPPPRAPAINSAPMTSAPGIPPMPACWRKARAPSAKGTFTNDSNNYPTACTATGSIYRVALTWREQDLYMRLDVETQP